VSGLNFESEGSGPAVVLLHGWALNLRVWDGVRAALAERFRLIAIDLPGHGRSVWTPERSSLESQAQQIRELIEPMAARYALIGWSFGGQLALRLAASPHERGRGLERLALIATSPRLTLAPDWPHGASPERLAAQAEDLSRDYRRTVSDFLELQVRGSAASGKALEQLRAALFDHGEAQPRALARGLELLREIDLRPLLPSVAVPTLVVAGQYDRITPPAAAHALAQALPAARYVEIRRAGHAPFLSHAAQVIALLSQFLPVQ
jgi:pimeloyl-[acyl-carrier protein] methyl ester esterase